MRAVISQKAIFDGLPKEGWYAQYAAWRTSFSRGVALIPTQERAFPHPEKVNLSELKQAKSFGLSLSKDQLFLVFFDGV